MSSYGFGSFVGARRMNSFGPIAPFYDELMHAVPYRMWADYYQLLLTGQGLFPKTLLDVCCGTGTVAELLTDMGYEVTGFDKSEPMIEEARRKAEDLALPIAYHVADAASFDLGKTFEAAYSFFDSLNYITDLRDLRSAIERVANHLERGGSFIFDLNTAFAFEAKMFDQQDTRARTRVKYNWVGDYDPTSRIIRVDMEFWVDGEKVVETHLQRAHRDEEIVEFLLDAGFVDIRSFDSYTLDPPRKRSDRVHYAARKQ